MLDVEGRGRLIDASALFVVSFLFSLLPYSVVDSPFPIGWDTVTYVRDMFRAERTGLGYFFVTSIDPRRGYLLVAFLIHRITGASFFTIEKFLPIVVSSLLAPVFYLIVFRCTGDRASTSNTRSQDPPP